MKIRIKSNFIRIRLTRHEVEKLRSEGQVSAETVFGPGKVFGYAVYSDPEATTLHADFSDNRIHFHLPEQEAKVWPDDQRTGFEAIQDNGAGGLGLLLEKDFICLDQPDSEADQLYPNQLAQQEK